MDNSLPIATNVPESVLLVRAQAWYCAFPIAEQALETCRPLPVQSVDGVPAFVRGLSVIRGNMTPVLHLGALIGGGASAPGRRLVVVRFQDRTVAFEVDEVLGVRQLLRAQLDSATPIVAGAWAERVSALGVLDGALLAWLETSRLVQNELLDIIIAEAWV